MRKTLWKSELNVKYRVIALVNTGIMRRRLMDLGFIEGAEIIKVLEGRKIVACRVNNSLIALRKSDASKIFVE